jgi:hypothetical protein
MAKSEYLQREEAAKKQLGAKGVKKRVKQLPTAARASLREMTGIDVSRKGVSVDPMGVAMALPLGKVLKAAKALRAAGQAGKASALASRVAAKEVGQGAGRGYSSLLTGKLREASESVFPRNSGARSGEYLGMNSREITANLARKTGRAAGVSMEDIRAFSKATANSTTGFTNFSKRVPKVVRGVGTVNPEGYAALQKLPDFLGQGAKQIARKIKKTPKRGGR